VVKIYHLIKSTKSRRLKSINKNPENCRGEENQQKLGTGGGKMGKEE
jgi:hypothetical protein